MGVACVLIRTYHLVLGVRSVPGEGLAGPTVDSRERFYNAVSLGYGLAWVWAARKTPIATRLVRFLAAVFFLGAVGRVASIVDAGWPQWFQTVLTFVELALPPVFLVLSRHVDRQRMEELGAAGVAR